LLTHLNACFLKILWIRPTSVAFPGQRAFADSPLKTERELACPQKPQALGRAH
jgi:hypothetical protein